MQKAKYITNKELLTEIHRSKMTYCSFLEPQYGQFHAIVAYEDITPENAEVIRNRLNNRPRKPRSPEEQEPKIETIHDLVFRVMTYEHVPLCTDKKRRSRAAAGEGHLRVNFPPFKHYRINEEGIVEEVGRSHWKNGLHNGEFCLDHGKMTNRLAQMFMLLVERYGRRGNWRSYCVDTETEALTQRGWLRYDQISADDIIMSYDNGRMVWSPVRSIYRGHYQGNMFHLTVAGLDALVTPQHKWVTEAGLKKVDYLLEKDRLILMGTAVDAPEATYPDAFVELVGWFLTEGTKFSSKNRNYPRMSICQNEGPYADRIRACVAALGSTCGESTDGKRVTFSLRKAECLRIAEVLENDGNKVPKMEFLLALSSEQRELLLNTMLDGDGWRTQQGTTTHRGYTQKCGRHMDAFTTLCALNGIRTSTRPREIVSFGKPTTIINATLFSSRRNVSRVENIDFHGGKRNGKMKGVGKWDHPNEPTHPYDGTVWCPKTDYGCFLARRNGQVFLTGNTYVDEMRSSALLQLAQVGLQFDESKGDNPFAFFTTTVQNSFTRIFNVERKNQNIRDDMLIIAGAKPSYTRQVEHELAQKFAAEGVTAAAPVKKVPAKRGRKPKKAETDTPTEE